MDLSLMEDCLPVGSISPEPGTSLIVDRGTHSSSPDFTPPSDPKLEVCSTTSEGESEIFDLADGSHPSDDATASDSPESPLFCAWESLVNRCAIVSSTAPFRKRRFSEKELDRSAIRPSVGRSDSSCEMDDVFETEELMSIHAAKTPIVAEILRLLDDDRILSSIRDSVSLSGLLDLISDDDPAVEPIREKLELVAIDDDRVVPPEAEAADSRPLAVLSEIRWNLLTLRLLDSRMCRLQKPFSCSSRELPDAKYYSERFYILDQEEDIPKLYPRRRDILSARGYLAHARREKLLPPDVLRGFCSRRQMLPRLLRLCPTAHARLRMLNDFLLISPHPESVSQLSFFKFLNVGLILSLNISPYESPRIFTCLPSRIAFVENVIEEDLLSRARDLGIEICHLPFPDRLCPTVEMFDRIKEKYLHCRERGKRTLIHCFSGSGRAVTVALALLFDEEPDQSMSLEAFLEKHDVTALGTRLSGLQRKFIPWPTRSEFGTREYHDHILHRYRSEFALLLAGLALRDVDEFHSFSYSHLFRMGSVSDWLRVLSQMATSFFTRERVGCESHLEDRAKIIPRFYSQRFGVLATRLSGKSLSLLYRDFFKVIVSA